ncbi:MAG: phage tail tape measure protein [Oscillospiraceae bacterium]|nr:phage tail tape measure protein [Oscillospiraceae bacterium]
MRTIANNIKGITVEINGNTKGLQNALGDVSKGTKSVNEELREINKSLKLDPGNTELLAQKQELLAKKVETAKEKLKLLQETQSQVEEQFKRGDIGAEQYRAFQRELVNTRNEVDNLQNAANSCSPALESMAAQGEKLKDAGDKISSAGEKLMPVTGAIVGAAAASAAAFKEMDAGYDIVVTKTGASGEALDSLKQQVDAVFSEIPTTAEDAGTAIGEVNTRFGLTGEACAEVSKEFIKFAQINGTDLNSAIDNVDTVMMKFNVDSAKSVNVLGLMTKVGQDTGISMETLQSTLSTNGATLKEMGLDLTASTNLLAQFESTGVDASTALAGLKKAQQNATADGKTMQEALNETISSIKDASSQTDALQIATDLFGKKGAAEMTQAIREGKLSIDDLSTSLSDYGNTVSNTFAETQDPFDEAKVALNNAKLAGAQLGATLLTSLQPILTGLINKVKSVTSWFKGLTESQRQTILKVGGVVAAVGPLLIIIGKVISAVGTIMTILPKVKAGMVAVNAVMAANPVGLVVAGVAALIAIFVILWNKCDWFREFWINLWDGIKAKCEEIWAGLQAIWAVVSPFVQQYIVEPVKALMEDIKNALIKVKDHFVTQWGLIKDIFKNIIDFVKNVFSGNWSEAWENIKNIFGDVWDGFVDMAKGPLNVVLGLVNGVIGGINKMVDGINSISFDIPSWVPGVGGNSIGFDIPHVPEIPLLAKGGILTSGSAIVGEAGPELLTMYNGKTIVQPLSRDQARGVTNEGNTYNITNVIKVDKISNDYDITKINQQLAIEQRRGLAAVGR